METSSLALAEGCSRLLEPTDEILVEVTDWQNKTSIRDAVLKDVFHQSAGLQRCGYDWFSMGYGNVNVLCLRCAKKLGWRW